AHARARGGLVEDHGDRLRPGERRATPAVRLDGRGQVENLGLLGGAQVVVAQEVAGHAVSPGSVWGIWSASAKRRVNSCSSSSPMMSGGARRMRYSFAALMMSPRSRARLATMPATGSAS